MTTPQPAAVADPGICLCGHPVDEHLELDPQCSADGCTCLHFRTSAPKTPPRVLRVSGLVNGAAGAAVALAATPSPVPRRHTEGVSIEKLIADGKKSTLVATTELAVYIEKLVDQLRGYLFDEYEAERERAEAEARRREQLEHIAALEAQLAEAKAKLDDIDGPPGAAPAAAATPPPQPREVPRCPECGQQFRSPHAIGPHLKMVHDYQATRDARPAAAPASPATAVNDLQCPDCGKTFTRKQALGSHRASHTRREPMACPDCGHMVEGGSIGVGAHRAKKHGYRSPRKQQQT